MQDLEGAYISMDSNMDSNSDEYRIPDHCSAMGNKHTGASFGRGCGCDAKADEFPDKEFEDVLNLCVYKNGYFESILSSLLLAVLPLCWSRLRPCDQELVYEHFGRPRGLTPLTMRLNRNGDALNGLHEEVYRLFPRLCQYAQLHAQCQKPYEVTTPTPEYTSDALRHIVAVGIGCVAGSPRCEQRCRDRDHPSVEETSSPIREEDNSINSSNVFGKLCGDYVALTGMDMADDNSHSDGITSSSVGNHSPTSYRNGRWVESAHQRLIQIVSLQESSTFSVVHEITEIDRIRDMCIAYCHRPTRGRESFDGVAFKHKLFILHGRGIDLVNPSTGQSLDKLYCRGFNDGGYDRMYTSAEMGGIGNRLLLTSSTLGWAIVSNGEARMNMAVRNSITSACGPAACFINEDSYNIDVVAPFTLGQSQLKTDETKLGKHEVLGGNGPDNIIAVSVWRDERILLYDLRASTRTPLATCFGLGRSGVSSLAGLGHVLVAGATGIDPGPSIAMWDLRFIQHQPARAFALNGYDTVRPPVHSIIVRPFCFHASVGSDLYTYNLFGSDVVVTETPYRRILDLSSHVGSRGRGSREKPTCVGVLGFGNSGRYKQHNSQQDLSIIRTFGVDFSTLIAAVGEPR